MKKLLLPIPLVFLFCACSILSDEQNSSTQTTDIKNDSASVFTPADRQDFIYYTTNPDELLTDIATRFTSSPDNAAALSRINDVDIQNFLKLNQAIRIPHYMLKK